MLTLPLAAERIVLRWNMLGKVGCNHLFDLLRLVRRGVFSVFGALAMQMPGPFRKASMVVVVVAAVDQGIGTGPRRKPVEGMGGI